jgi:hypothetical protein
LQSSADFTGKVKIVDDGDTIIVYTKAGRRPSGSMGLMPRRKHRPMGRRLNSSQ